jgi:hypothetical protein
MRSDAGEERGTEIPHICWLVGRSSDAREVLGLAVDLKVSRLHAIGILIAWEELVFRGTSAGRLPGVRPKDLAAALDWKRDPKILTRALTDAGVLEIRKGVLCHPYWPSSRSGEYMRERKESRAYWRNWKRQKRRSARDAAAAAAAGGAGSESSVDPVQPMSIGHHMDIQRTSNGVHTESRPNKDNRPMDGSPPDPPQSGGSLGKRRWDQIRKMFNRSINPPRCEHLLGLYSEAEFTLCAWVLTNRITERLAYISQKKRAFGATSLKFLAEKLFTQFEPEFQKKMAECPTVPLAVEQAEKEQLREAGKREWILELLRDATLPEGEKETRKAKWLQANPDEAEWLKGALSN